MTTEKIQTDGLCLTCQGSGSGKALTNHLGPDDYEVEVDCPDCKGTGAGTISQSECVPAESVRSMLADAPSPTPRTDALIAKLDLEPESRLVFVIRQIVNHAKDLERKLEKALGDPPQTKSNARD